MKTFLKIVGKRAKSRCVRKNEEWTKLQFFKNINTNCSRRVNVFVVGSVACCVCLSVYLFVCLFVLIIFFETQTLQKSIPIFLLFCQNRFVLIYHSAWRMSARVRETALPLSLLSLLYCCWSNLQFFWEPHHCQRRLLNETSSETTWH